MSLIKKWFSDWLHFENITFLNWKRMKLFSLCLFVNCLFYKQQNHPSLVHTDLGFPFSIKAIKTHLSFWQFIKITVWSGDHKHPRHSLLHYASFWTLKYWRNKWTFSTEICFCFCFCLLCTLVLGPHPFNRITSNFICQMHHFIISNNIIFFLP